MNLLSWVGLLFLLLLFIRGRKVVMAEATEYLERVGQSPWWVWLAGVGALLCGVIFLKGLAPAKSKEPEAPAPAATAPAVSARSATTSGANSPLVLTGNNSTVTINQGISQEQAKKVAEETAREFRRGLKPQQRVITDEQEGKIRLAVAYLNGSKVKFRYIFGDKEAKVYGERVLGIFQRLGLTLEIDAIGVSMPPFYGVTVHVRDANKAPLVGAAIYKGFQSAGIEPQVVVHPEWPEKDQPVVEIAVGLAPPDE